MKLFIIISIILLIIVICVFLLTNKTEKYAILRNLGYSPILPPIWRLPNLKPFENKYTGYKYDHLKIRGGPNM